MIERLKNFGWLGAEESVRLGLGFVFTLLLANHLGTGQFGAYGYIFGFVILFTPFIAFGLDPLITKHSVEQPDRLGAIFQAAILLRCLAALLAFAVLFALMAVLPMPQGTSLRLTAIAAITILVIPALTSNVIFKALEMVRIVAIPRLIITLIATGTAIAFVLQGRGLEDFIWVRALEAIAMAIAALLAFVIIRPSNLSFAPAFDFQLAKSFVKNGFPLMLSGLAGLIYMRIDQVMIGQLSGVDELGRYTVAVRFSDAALFVPMALQAAFFPALVRASKADKASYRQELRSFFDIMSLAMWAVCAAVIAGGSLAIYLLLDPAYSSSTAMLAILALGLPLCGLGVARSCHLTIRGWFWTSSVMTGVGAAANIALNFVLIPSFGGIGAAIASLLSYWLAVHGMCYVLHWTRDLGHEVLRALNPVAAAMRLFTLYRSKPGAEVIDG